MMRVRGALLFLSLCALPCGPCLAVSGVAVTETGPIHEAYVAPVLDAVVLDARAERPPNPIQEQAGEPADPDFQWIEGYWSFDDELDSYVWVTGVWRRPPPEHRWVPGQWKRVDEGWVWLRGFWSAVPEGDLDYIEQPPPDSLEEDVEDPEGDGYFWMPGYWQWDEDDEEYQWLEGSWQKLDPNWVLVPGSYLWRPEGYLFTAPYWDYPIEERGQPFANVTVEPGVRDGLVYQPTDGLEPVDVVRRLVVDYPNYATLFCHHYYYHPRFWSQFWGTPPWWAWRGWWSLGWRNQWALWWWYTHPGYPHPRWLGAHVSGKIPPPSARLLRAARKGRRPLIVTPKGVVPAHRLYRAMADVEGKRGAGQPVMPSNRRQRDEIWSKAEVRGVAEERALRPTGRRALGSREPRAEVVRPTDLDGRGRVPRRGAPRPAVEPPKPRGDRLRGVRALPPRPADRRPEAPIRPVREVQTPRPRRGEPGSAPSRRRAPRDREAGGTGPTPPTERRPLRQRQEAPPPIIPQPQGRGPAPDGSQAERLRPRIRSRDEQPERTVPDRTQIRRRPPVRAPETAPESGEEAPRGVGRGGPERAAPPRQTQPPTRGGAGEQQAPQRARELQPAAPRMQPPSRPRDFRAPGAGRNLTPLAPRRSEVDGGARRSSINPQRSSRAGRGGTSTPSRTGRSNGGRRGGGQRAARSR